MRGKLASSLRMRERGARRIPLPAARSRAARMAPIGNSPRAAAWRGSIPSATSFKASRSSWSAACAWACPVFGSTQTRITSDRGTGAGAALPPFSPNSCGKPPHKAATTCSEGFTVRCSTVTGREGLSCRVRYRASSNRARSGRNGEASSKTKAGSASSSARSATFAAGAKRARKSCHCGPDRNLRQTGKISVWLQTEDSDMEPSRSC